MFLSKQIYIAEISKENKITKCKMPLVLLWWTQDFIYNNKCFKLTRLGTIS